MLIINNKILLSILNELLKIHLQNNIYFQITLEHNHIIFSIRNNYIIYSIKYTNLLIHDEFTNFITDNIDMLYKACNYYKNGTSTFYNDYILISENDLKIKIKNTCYEHIAINVLSNQNHVSFKINSTILHNIIDICKSYEKFLNFNYEDNVFTINNIDFCEIIIDLYKQYKNISVNVDYYFLDIMLNFLKNIDNKIIKCKIYKNSKDEGMLVYSYGNISLYCAVV